MMGDLVGQVTQLLGLRKLLQRLDPPSCRPNTKTTTTPTARTTVVIVNTPPNPSAAAKKPMIAGAVMLPIRPKALDKPVPVARTHVGKTSGV